MQHIIDIKLSELSDAGSLKEDVKENISVLVLEIPSGAHKNKYSN